MLKYNPAERIYAKTAVDNPYFDSLESLTSLNINDGSSQNV